MGLGRQYLPQRWNLSKNELENGSIVKLNPDCLIRFTTKDSIEYMVLSINRFAEQMGIVISKEYDMYWVLFGCGDEAAFYKSELIVIE